MLPNNSIIYFRSHIIFYLLGALALVILGKILKLQLVEKEKWENLNQDNFFKYREVRALRGNILSDDGQLLATSLPFFHLAFDPTIASDEVFSEGIDSLSFLLANYFLEKPPEDYRLELEYLRQNNRKYIILSKTLLTHEQCDTIRQWPILRLGRFGGGLLFEKIEKRYHPYGNLARRTVGLEEDTTRKIFGRGLEYSYNDILTGQKGRGLFQKAPHSNWRLLPNEDFVRPENGYDVYTTIDIKLQDYVHEQLEMVLKEHKANYGCVLVMEVKTGHIKAIANLGRSGENRYVENYNYAIGNQGVKEPGSTLKTASFMALLEAHQDIDINDTVNTVEGEYTFYDECVMKDVQTQGYGLLSIADVFKKSSNIGVSRLIFKSFRTNPQKFIDYLHTFGLTQPIDFQIKGAGIPYITQVSDKTWSGCSLPWISIGYELKLSPLQMISFYNAIANNGQLIQPIIVEKIIKQDKIIKYNKTKIINKKICSDTTLHIIQKLLENVVSDGTANNIFTEAYRIAGKTGTTHKLQNGQYIDNYYTSFIGYFPAEQPVYTCMIVVDNPQGDKHFGGNVSAPLFRKIADKLYFSNIYKSPKIGNLTNNLPSYKAGYYPNLSHLATYFKIKQKGGNSNWVRIKALNDTIEWVKRIEFENLVPNAVGMSLTDALYLLENKGLKVHFKGEGHIVKQSLFVGTRIKKGMSIILTLKP